MDVTKTQRPEAEGIDPDGQRDRAARRAARQAEPATRGDIEKINRRLERLEEMNRLRESRGASRRKRPHGVIG